MRSRPNDPRFTDRAVKPKSSSLAGGSSKSKTHPRMVEEQMPYGILYVCNVCKAATMSLDVLESTPCHTAETDKPAMPFHGEEPAEARIGDCWVSDGIAWYQTGEKWIDLDGQCRENHCKVVPGFHPNVREFYVEGWANLGKFLSEDEMKQIAAESQHELYDYGKEVIEYEGWMQLTDWETMKTVEEHSEKKIVYRMKTQCIITTHHVDVTAY